MSRRNGDSVADDDGMSARFPVRDQSGGEGGQRDQAGDRRDEAADDRDRASDERNQVGDRRDREADARDRAGDQRDRAGERRDEAADARDRAGDKRDEAAKKLEARRDSRVAAELRGRSVTARRDAARDRAQAAQDRQDGASERAQAERDRDVSVADRSWGAGERGAAELDRDAAELDRAAAALEREGASFDGLTGAYLRGPGLAEVHREMARARRTGDPLLVAFIDVDHLKAVNDSLGHTGGDRLLVAVATGLRAQLRAYDLVIRFGGDEFICVLAGLDILEAAARLERVNTCLAEGPEPGSITVGLAASEPQDSFEDVVARADAALYDQRHRQRT